MTVQILISGPNPASRPPTSTGSSEQGQDGAFAELLTGRREALGPASPDTAISDPHAAKSQNTDAQEPASQEKDSLELSLSELAVALATQVAHLRNPQAQAPGPRADVTTTSGTSTLVNVPLLRQAGHDSRLSTSSIEIDTATELQEALPDSGVRDAHGLLAGSIHNKRAADSTQFLKTFHSIKNTGDNAGLDAKADVPRTAAVRAQTDGAGANIIITAASAGNATGSAAPTESVLSTLTEAGNGSHGLPAAALQTGTGLLSAPASLTSSTPAVGVPLHHPQWPQAVGQQFMQLLTSGAGQGTQTAELRLDPPELGPLRITIQITDNIAHAVFMSSHAPVRQALEQALPQLQEQLAQAGLSLGQASVSDQDPQQHAFAQQTPEPGSADTDRISRDAQAGLPEPARQRLVASNALVDTFA